MTPEEKINTAKWLRRECDRMEGLSKCWLLKANILRLREEADSLEAEAKRTTDDRGQMTEGAWPTDMRYCEVK